MKKIRKIASNPVFIFSLLFNFIFVSCNRDEIAKQQIEQKSSETFSKLNSGNNPNAILSGKTLFDEIVFGLTNNLNLDHVNQIKTTTDEFDSTEKQQFQKVVTDIDTKILEQDPQYFNNFGTNLYSKDFNQINSAIQNIQQTIERAIMAIPEYRDKYLLGVKIADSVDIKTFTNPDGTLNQNAFYNYLVQKYGENSPETSSICGATLCALALGIYIFIVQSVAFGINIYAAIFCRTSVRNNCNSSLVNNSQLSNEIMVNQIYEAL